MLYSFYCKKCGESFISENVAKVQKFKEEHYTKVPGLQKNKPYKLCTFVKTERGTIARPSLIPFINAEIAAMEASVNN